MAALYLRKLARWQLIWGCRFYELAQISQMAANLAVGPVLAQISQMAANVHLRKLARWRQILAVGPVLAQIIQMAANLAVGPVLAQISQMAANLDGGKSWL